MNIHLVLILKINVIITASLKILCNVQFKKIFRSVGCWFFSVHCKLKSKKRNLKNILQQKQTRINNCFTKENLKRYVFAIFIIMISYLTKTFFLGKKAQLLQLCYSFGHSFHPRFPICSSSFVNLFSFSFCSDVLCVAFLALGLT